MGARWQVEAADLDAHDSVCVLPELRRADGATELRATCVDEHATPTAITNAAFTRRDLRGKFIIGSGVWVVPLEALLPVPNGLLGPQNYRRAIPHTARVLCRCGGSLINLGTDESPIPREYCAGAVVP